MTSTGWQNRYSAAAPDLRADEIRVLPNLYSVRYSSCKNCWVNPEIDVSLSLQSIMLKVQPNIYLQLVSSFPLLFPKIRPSRAHAYRSEIHLKMSEDHNWNSSDGVQFPGSIPEADPGNVPRDRRLEILILLFFCIKHSRGILPGKWCDSWIPPQQLLPEIRNPLIGQGHQLTGGKRVDAINEY